MRYFLTEKVTKRLFLAEIYDKIEDGRISGKGRFYGSYDFGYDRCRSIRHNNRSFSAANVDRSRTEQNIVFCNEDLKQVYHMVFDEALAAYNAKKTKTRDKIPDYYEHIRQSKQEKLFHEAIFQIGNMSDCGCGTPDGEQAAAALKDFAESFAERNPHLRVFNMVLHMDEATPISMSILSLWQRSSQEDFLQGYL